VLRPADGDDLERARQAEADRPRRLSVCERIFQNGDWPLQLIDVEPLLDEGRTILHYLGPHRLDASGVIAALRVSCNLDILLEPAGRDVDEADMPEEAHGCGACGSSGGCGAGGGCGTDRHAGACSSCAVKSLLLARRT
jgi:hypothetical protein